MLWSGWSQFFLWSPVTLASFLGLWSTFQEHQQQLVSLLLLCPTTFSAFWQDPSICLSFCFLYSLCLYFHSIVQSNNKNILDNKLFSSWKLTLSLPIWLELGDPFVSQSLREFHVSHFQEQILVFASTISQYGKILISRIIPSGSPF